VQKTLNPLQVIAVERCGMASSRSTDDGLEFCCSWSSRSGSRVRRRGRAYRSLPVADRALWATAFYAGLRRVSCARCGGMPSTSTQA